MKGAKLMSNNISLRAQMGTYVEWAEISHVLKL